MCGNVSELAHIGRKEIWSKGGSYEEWPYDGHVFHEDDARGYSGGGINSKEKDPTAGIRLVFIPKGMEPSFYLWDSFLIISQRYHRKRYREMKKFNSVFFYNMKYRDTW